jgi:DNA gyrase subunit A
MSNIEKIEVGSSIRDNMMLYSIEAVTNRALPFLEDGFKPSQRKVLYTMKTMGLSNKQAKCANITGQNMKISPHGESYPTLVRMTREKEVLLTPFIDGKGSFGKVYSSTMQEAAERYTEAKLAPICKEVMDTLHKHPNNMVNNYDGTMKEPSLLSLPFPNILANPQEGMGVGYACNFPSFNLKELCDTCIEILNGNDNYEDLVKIMPCPDFTTGGKALIEPEEIEKIFKEGRGRILLQATINNDDQNNVLEILEIPYTTTAEKVINSIQKEYGKNKLQEVVDVIDEIGIDGFKVSILYKPNTNVEELIKKLYVLTPLQEYFSCNMTLVYNMRPETMGVIEIIKNWIEHRKIWVQEEINFDIQEKSHKKMLLEGLEQILLNLDKAVEIVKNSKTDEDVLKGLKLEFNLNDEQAEFVANIKLRNFNQDYILDKTSEIQKISNEITQLQNTDINQKMIEDLEYIKDTYGINRKTEVVYDWEPISLTKFVKAKQKKIISGKSVLFTGLNTLRRMPENTTAKTNEGHDRHEIDNSGEVLIFTSLGKVFKIKVHTIKPGSLINADTLLRDNELELGESIIYVTPLIPENDVFIVFDNNKAARYTQQTYVTTGNKRCFKKGFSTKAAAVYVKALDEDTIVNIPGYKQIDTSKYLSKGSKLTQGVRIR